jgi:hypothetical protein
MTELSVSAIRTYRYLRLSIVALAVYLAISVGLEMVDGDAGWLGSISAYYYTPVRSVFVGTLTAMSIGLIAIKGRDAAGEDLMLNIAGMLAPVVAVVPTPIAPRSDDAACANNAKKCIPDEFMAGVTNNMQTLIVLGILGVAMAWLLAWKMEQLGSYLGPLAIGSAVFAAFAVWFFVSDDWFPRFAHYVAAVPMFGLICAVAVINGRSVEPDQPASRRYPLLASTTYSGLYRWIGLAIGAATAVTAVAGVANAKADVDPFPHWVFMAEATLLILFACFWVLQTMQFWNEGAPD